MNIEYRSPTAEEWTAFGAAVSRGFGSHPPTDDHGRERWQSFYEVANAVGAFDGDQIVGTSGSFVSDTTVPGGSKLPAAMVTIVTVAATHRRRGILTNMMKRLLEESRDRGEPIATLWASESIIYGRFGYGMAGQHHYVEIPTARGQLLHTPEVSGSVQFVDSKRVLEVGPEIWERAAADRPGMPERAERGWNWAYPPPEKEKPENRGFFAVYEENGRADGYVSYQTKERGGPFGGHDIQVKDLIPATNAAHAALWRFLLSVDLIHSVKYETMPLDDPLWWMLADPRHLKRTPYDAIWLRILDVERTLSARTYSEPLDIVFETEDEFCPWAGGRYRLNADASGRAECAKTNSAPDVVLPAASLATCYFGNAKLADLARAGRVHEKTAGSIARADRAFAADMAPWCPLHY